MRTPAPSASSWSCALRLEAAARLAPHRSRPSKRARLRQPSLFDRNRARRAAPFLPAHIPLPDRLYGGYERTTDDRFRNLLVGVGEAACCDRKAVCASRALPRCDFQEGSETRGSGLTAVELRNSSERRRDGVKLEPAPHPVRDVVSRTERINQDVLRPLSIFTTKIIIPVAERDQCRCAYALGTYEVIAVLIIVLGREISSCAHATQRTPGALTLR